MAVHPDAQSNNSVSAHGVGWRTSTSDLRDVNVKSSRLRIGKLSLFYLVTQYKTSPRVGLSKIPLLFYLFRARTK